MWGPNHTTHAFSTFYCKYNLGVLDLQIIYLFYHKIKSNFIDIFLFKSNILKIALKTKSDRKRV